MDSVFWNFNQPQCLTLSKLMRDTDTDRDTDRDTDKDTDTDRNTDATH